MKKLGLLFSLLVIAGMVLTACGAKATPAPVAAPTEVTFWHAYGTGSAEETALAAILAQAAIDMPQYKINVLQVPFNDIFNKYDTEDQRSSSPLQRYLQQV